MTKSFKTIGKCAYCKDPIYAHQAKRKYGEDKYHKGCLEIKE